MHARIHHHIHIHIAVFFFFWSALYCIYITRDPSSRTAYTYHIFWVYRRCISIALLYRQTFFFFLGGEKKFLRVKIDKYDMI